MAPTTATAAHVPLHPLQPLAPLAGRPVEWPAGALAAYRSVLGELEGWCRAHDAPRLLNSWVAEEAIRRGW